MTQKQIVHDWSSGQLVITEVDGEMTDEEYAQYLIYEQNVPQLQFTQVEPDAN